MRKLLSVCLLVTIVGVTVYGSGLADQGKPQDIPVAESLKYTRVYADSSGASHFADEEMEFELVDFAPPAPAISLSEVFNATSVTVISSPLGWYGDWHPTPQRQFVFILTGQLEAEVSDGEVRTFGPGSVALLEDTVGQGHISRIVSKERCYIVVVPLVDE